ncbi:hypothetical protein PISMIDRAFT_685255 [Pisolithus microcarpus 441]|uniref:Uncharacterized protein n=1 Tax=Pisolithus microcarpus 441 TaxID=765257 RepID=A0A0C9YU04_9AGAM|nr:hypothetical protein PISMIDRAFT_685255 [Pisolithus microcarpus 441]
MPYKIPENEDVYAPRNEHVANSTENRSEQICIYRFACSSQVPFEHKGRKLARLLSGEELAIWKAPLDIYQTPIGLRMNIATGD